ncbi:MAG: CopG family transcriptional regulator [Spirochaetales bacterium]|nr:MAG: CopG family transcriptional regulator [Spirochaetales bacterium]
MSRGKNNYNIPSVDRNIIHVYTVSMEKIQILFPEPVLKKVRKIAEIEDRTLSELIRRAVDQWLDRTSISGSKVHSPEVPVYHCGSILIPAKDLREAANQSRLHPGL